MVATFMFSFLFFSTYIMHYRTFHDHTSGLLICSSTIDETYSIVGESIFETSS